MKQKRAALKSDYDRIEMGYNAALSHGHEVLKSDYDRIEIVTPMLKQNLKIRFLKSDYDRIEMEHSD